MSFDKEITQRVLSEMARVNSTENLEFDSMILAVLHYKNQGKTIPEIAELLNKSEESVSSTISVAKRKGLYQDTRRFKTDKELIIAYKHMGYSNPEISTMLDKSMSTISSVVSVAIRNGEYSSERFNSIAKEPEAEHAARLSPAQIHQVVDNAEEIIDAADERGQVPVVADAANTAQDDVPMDHTQTARKIIQLQDEYNTAVAEYENYAEAKAESGRGGPDATYRKLVAAADKIKAKLDALTV